MLWKKTKDKSSLPSVPIQVWSSLELCQACASVDRPASCLSSKSAFFHLSKRKLVGIVFLKDILASLAPNNQEGDNTEPMSFTDRAQFGVVFNHSARFRLSGKSPMRV